MADIHDEVITRIYREYKQALHSSEKSDTIEKGVREILLDLKRYTNNPERFQKESKNLIRELQDTLDRYYYHDREFSDQLLFEAKAYALELSESPS
jgi:hypothetical protein